MHNEIGLVQSTNKQKNNYLFTVWFWLTVKEKLNILRMAAVFFIFIVKSETKTDNSLVNDTFASFGDITKKRIY